MPKAKWNLLKIKMKDLVSRLCELKNSNSNKRDRELKEDKLRSFNLQKVWLKQISTINF